MARKVILIALTVALGLLLAGMVYAQAGSTEKSAKTTQATGQRMDPTMEAHHHMMRINHDEALEHSLALYHYARNAKGELNTEIVQEHVEGIDRALAKADVHLTKVSEGITNETPKEKTEIQHIRANYSLAFEHEDRLKRACEETPLDRKVIETESEAIHKDLKKARTEMAALQSDVNVRKPEEPARKTTAMGQ
jgi:hypothetical protein